MRIVRPVDREYVLRKKKTFQNFFFKHSLWGKTPCWEKKTAYAG